MDRRSFIKKFFKGAVVITAVPVAISLIKEEELIPVEIKTDYYNYNKGMWEYIKKENYVIYTGEDGWNAINKAMQEYIERDEWNSIQ